MKSKIIVITAIVLLLGSLSLFLYPEISKAAYLNDAVNKANTFDETVKNIIPSKTGSDKYAGSQGDQDESKLMASTESEKNGQADSFDFPVLYQEDIDRLLTDSRSYNEQLELQQNLNKDFSISALNLNRYGIWNGLYGYIKIPTLNLVLPLYLGSSDYNMSEGVTHLMGTSLPIGGDNTNSVIAGHTGYIGKEFFDAIPALSLGDSVFLTNYWGTLEYKVVNSKAISDTDTSDLYVQKGKDLLTLLTCADYGQRRYQVQCERKK